MGNLFFIYNFEINREIVDNVLSGDYLWYDLRKFIDDGYVEYDDCVSCQKDVFYWLMIKEVE